MRRDVLLEARGRALEVIKLPVPQSPVLMGADAAREVLATPGTLVRPAGFRLAASYVNFLLCNGALILPSFDDPHDALARDILAEQFPGRAIRQVPGREQEVWNYFRNNPDAVASLRAPIFEDKVIDYILELATINEKSVSREDLYKEDEADA